jgi:uncharacterized protein Yka (UPF0111/DUF47 family)
MGSSPLAPEIKVQITGKDTGVNLAIAELRTQLTQLKAAQDATANSAQRMGQAERGAAVNITEARGAAKLLSQEVGVNLNRHLTSVLANSKVLGPLLQSAFPIAAAIGFGEVIASFAEKFSTLIADTFIFTDEMKALEKANLDANKQILKSAEHTKELAKAFDLIGVKGSERSVIQIQQIGKEIDKVQKQINLFNDQRFAARQGLLGTGGKAVTLPADIDAQQGIAQARLTQLQQEQFNLEKEGMTNQAEERISAAAKERSQTETLARARLASIRTGLHNELELYKATGADQEQANQVSFDRGLETVAQYFAKRKELAATEAQKEIAALQAERDAEQTAGRKAIADFDREIATVRANATGEAGKQQLAGLAAQRGAAVIENRTKLADLDNKIAVAREKAGTKQGQLDDEQFRKQEELNRKTLDFEAQIAQAQGARFDAASAKIDAEARDMEIALQQAGFSPDQIAKELADFRQAKADSAAFQDQRVAGEDQLRELQNERDRIQLQEKLGQVAILTGEQNIAAVEAARLPALRQIAAAMQRTAVTPEQKQQASDFARQIDQIAASSNLAAQRMAEFKNSAIQSLGQNLTTFLGSTIDQVHGVGDAFAKLGQSVIGSLQQIVAQLLVTMLMTRLLKSSFGGMLGFSGGGLAAAPGHAEGGIITGPGGPTGDAIPAMLSDGEYVVRSAAVEAIGIRTLDAINAGLRIPAIRGLGGIPHFAQGGLVTNGRSSDGLDVKMGIGLDEGLILKYLTSKKAGRIVLQHLSNNPKAAQKALSRSD